MLDAHARSGKWQRALGLLEEMLSHQAPKRGDGLQQGTGALPPASMGPARGVLVWTMFPLKGPGPEPQVPCEKGGVSAMGQTSIGRFDLELRELEN